MTEIFEDIHLHALYYLASVTDMSGIFLRWADLKRDQKAIVSVHLSTSLLRSEVSTFMHTIQAFEEWEALQNEEGAPGFRESAIKTHFLDNENCKTLNTIFTTIGAMAIQIKTKQQLHTELLSYNKIIDILRNYKWRILTIRQRKEEQMACSGKNLKIDLNAGGDSAWS